MAIGGGAWQYFGAKPDRAHDGLLGPLVAPSSPVAEKVFGFENEPHPLLLLLLLFSVAQTFAPL